MGSIDIEDDIEDENEELLEDAGVVETAEESEESAEAGEESVDLGVDEAGSDDELEKAVQEAALNFEKYLRAKADLENFKKRAEKERADLQSYANEKLMLEVLPVADNLTRALAHAGDDSEKNIASLTEGVTMTVGQLFKVLEKFGLTEVKAVGEKFNPEFHHAISHDNTTDAAPGTVVSEFQKGFTLKGRLIRPAMVSVAEEQEGEE
ncbi:MAG: nucleotide exchange factor GrpE [Proteobacteria bacterium]|nr:nucleotide exchange factor GrpE [Pseudomonadota bacterium]